MSYCHKHNLNVGDRKIEKSIFSVLKDLYLCHFKKKTFESNQIQLFFLNLELHLLLKHDTKRVIPLSCRIPPAVFLHVYSLELIGEVELIVYSGCLLSQEQRHCTYSRISEGRGGASKAVNAALGCLAASMPQIEVSNCPPDPGSGSLHTCEGAHSHSVVNSMQHPSWTPSVTMRRGAGRGPAPQQHLKEAQAETHTQKHSTQNSKGRSDWDYQRSLIKMYQNHNFSFPI